MTLLPIISDGMRGRSAMACPADNLYMEALTMNIKEVHNQIKKINALDKGEDYESAHIEEDKLLWGFVEFVAGLDNEYSLENEIANELMSFFENTGTPRWYA